MRINIPISLSLPLSPYLLIGRFIISTGVNGPGRRFVIWFQGCPFRCKGCFNPEFWDDDRGILMDVGQIITQVNSSSGIEGVTFTGGEPLAQAKGLLFLAESIKSMGLSITCYTGYLLQEILDDKLPYAKELLNWIDLLIDGPYKEEENAPLFWRGSRNQKVYFLTDRYRDLSPSILKEGMREAEITTGDDGIVMTGIFDMEMWKRLSSRLGGKNDSLSILSN
ncbi:radical SAM protein [bacterium]|nr:radical SAM protein [bacterium]